MADANVDGIAGPLFHLGHGFLLLLLLSQFQFSLSASFLCAILCAHLGKSNSKNDNIYNFSGAYVPDTLSTCKYIFNLIFGPAVQGRPSHISQGEETGALSVTVQLFSLIVVLSSAATLSTKVRPVRAMVFPVIMYGCESWIIKKAECQRVNAFELWCWRRLLRVP